MQALESDAISRCAAVESTVNYLDDMDELPVFYADKVRDNNLKLSTHRITVRDARPISEGLSLDREGFRLVDCPTATRNFRDADEVQRVYRPETERLIADLTGARKVLATGVVLRWGERSAASGSLLNSRPARFVHVDYSRKSFDEFANMHLINAGIEAVDPWLKGRYVAFNIWRVLSPPPQDVPLGICAASSTSPADVVTGLAVIDPPNAPELRFESSLFRFNPEHLWFYFSNMQPTEALVFKAFDSERHRVQGCPHSAFNDPTCPEGVTPRASVEIRAYAYFG
ncbi:MAG TPA: CmcJ/NvfI family oxidoreductase [Steroidobacteraceae bacterium]|nr:CmcJ/NvfI family oxidoreductase [Steroidobacteraceae bacterium]